MMVFFRHALILAATIAAAMPMHSQIQIAEAIDIGVCYGLLGNDLPPATDVINLYKRYGIEKLRLFDPNPEALNALRGSKIKVIIGIRNQDLRNLAASQDAVSAWFSTNIEPYRQDVEFTVISVGNEIIPGEEGQYIVPVMQFLQNILVNKGLGSIKVSTAISTYPLGSSYPPSSGAFREDARGVIKPVLDFLSKQGSPLLVNVYPYYAKAGDRVNVRMDYAQFTATEVIVKDGSLNYYNLFDATLDGFFWAMEREGVNNVNVLVTESGWPSGGNGDITTPELAATYNRNFVKRITSGKGTPKRPDAHIEGFIFAMFNENQKPAGIEQNFGLFYPNKQPVYPVFS